MRAKKVLDFMELAATVSAQPNGRFALSWAILIDGLRMRFERFGAHGCDRSVHVGARLTKHSAFIFD